MINDANKTKVIILTGNYRIKGKINIPTGVRITDYILEAKDFVAITDATVWNLDGDQLIKQSFIDVSREHIEVIAPDE